MSLVGDGGGEEELWHVRSGGCSVTHVPSGEWWRRGGALSSVGDEGGEEEHVRSGGRSVTHVPSGGWWRRGGALPCTQWGTLSDTCPQWGMVRGEEELWHVPRRGGSVSCTQWGMGEERRSSAMYAVGDAQ